MQKEKLGFFDNAKAILNEISGTWLNPDKLADMLDSIKSWRSYMAHAIGLPTTSDISKVENLIANSQLKIQRLQSSVVNLESLVSEIFRASTKPPTSPRKKIATQPLAAKRAQPSKIGKKSPSTLLEIDLKGKKIR